MHSVSRVKAIIFISLFKIKNDVCGLKLKSMCVNLDVDYKHGIGAVVGLVSEGCITQRKNYFSAL